MYDYIFYIYMYIYTYIYIYILHMFKGLALCLTEKQYVKEWFYNLYCSYNGFKTNVINILKLHFRRNKKTSTLNINNNH